jgi:glyoxylase-like metal-dependent hydrolase (beta-lactamase superfamily II)
MAAALAANDGVFLYKVGSIEVYTMVETSGAGRPSVLIGDKALVDRYLPSGGYKSATNTFLVRSSSGVTIIDTGFGGAIFDRMKDLGVKPEDVTSVLLTHTHGDHTGGLVKNGKASFPLAKLYISRQEYDWANATTKALFAAYDGRLEYFLPGTLDVPRAIVPGIGAAAAFGHTPGHTVYLIQSGGSRLLVWGDLIHVQDVQFPAPQVAVTYDSDAKAAVEARQTVMAWAAANKTPIAGHHLVYPAMGYVESDGQGYRFVPLK